MIHIVAYIHTQIMIRRFISGSYLFTNELLPKELTGLEHVGDVVERTETFVFVLVLLLNRDRGRMEVK